MKISRVLFAASLALLTTTTHAAVAPPPPPKPPADGGADPDRDVWRARGLAICMGDLVPTEGATTSDLQATCGCALDRVAGSVRSDALPSVDPGSVRTQLGSQLLVCASDRRAAVAAAIARRLAAPPAGDAPPTDAKPVDGAPPAPEPGEAPKRSGSDSGGWFDGLSLPGWITDSGLPSWAWVVLGVIAFLVLRGLKRGGDQRDLIGPPPHMRLGARANSPAPRRADPPQRG